MKRRPRRYTLESPEPRVTLELPEGAELLHCRVVDGRPLLYALVEEADDPAKTVLEPRTFHIVPTGVELPDGDEDFAYVAALEFENPSATWHVFEVS